METDWNMLIFDGAIFLQLFFITGEKFILYGVRDRKRWDLNNVFILFIQLINQLEERSSNF